MNTVAIDPVQSMLPYIRLTFLLSQLNRYYDCKRPRLGTFSWGAITEVEVGGGSLDGEAGPSHPGVSI